MADRVNRPPSRRARAPICALNISKQGSDSRLRRAYIVLASGVAIFAVGARERCGTRRRSTALAKAWCPVDDRSGPQRTAPSDLGVEDVAVELPVAGIDGPE